MMYFLLLFVVLLFGTGCQDHCYLPLQSEIWVRLTDSLGNALKIEDLYLRQDGQRHDCVRSDGAPQRCRFTTLIGPATLVVSTAGRDVERPMELIPEDNDEGGECSIRGLGMYDVVYDGPDCDPGALVAVRGDLVGLDGLPDTQAREVSIQTVAEMTTRSDECVVADGRFVCPALVGRSASYTVTATLGASRLEQMVEVAATDCQISAPAELHFDRRNVPCTGEVTPAVRVYTLDGPDNALPDSVRSTRFNGETSDCVLEPPGRSPGPRAALCPATSATGGGKYTVEVSYHGQTKKEDVIVYDDGCHARTSQLRIAF